MSQKTQGTLFVVGQFILLVLLVVLPHGTLWFVSDAIGSIAVTVIMGGLFVVLLGIVSLGSSLTATPVPKRDAVLRTSGMYKIVRHPIYSGIILIGFGLVALSASVWGIILCAGLILLLAFKARFEERLLCAKFPEYVTYAAGVGRLFPFVGRMKNTKS